MNALLYLWVILLFVIVIGVSLWAKKKAEEPEEPEAPESHQTKKETDDLTRGQHMELAPEQRREIKEFQERWKGLTDDELLDEDAKWLRPAPGKHLGRLRSLLEIMAMDEEMARRGIPRARRVGRQEEVIKEMADETYGPEAQEEKDQMTRKMMDIVHRLD